MRMLDDLYMRQVKRALKAGICGGQIKNTSHRLSAGTMTLPLDRLSYPVLCRKACNSVCSVTRGSIGPGKGVGPLWLLAKALS